MDASVLAEAVEPHLRSDGRLAMAVGCEFGFEATQATTAVLQVAPALDPALQLRREHWDTEAAHHGYTDLYGNRCERFTIPPGASRAHYEAQVVLDPPLDTIAADASRDPTDVLPDETLAFLMPSRFCQPDELGSEAWQRFGEVAPGGRRVQAVIDYVHELIEFDARRHEPVDDRRRCLSRAPGRLPRLRPSRDQLLPRAQHPVALRLRLHLGVGVAEPVRPMDFAAWFEAYLDGEWHTFDPRNNTPRVGRVIVGRGRDAADVALITSLGSLTLTEFTVKAEQVGETA